jgi:hypothetical protein
MLRCLRLDRSSCVEVHDSLIYAVLYISFFSFFLLHSLSIPIGYNFIVAHGSA